MIVMRRASLLYEQEMVFSDEKPEIAAQFKLVMSELNSEGNLTISLP